jgi:hypothetical protein
LVGCDEPLPLGRPEVLVDASGSLGRSNIDGSARVGSALVGLSGSRTGSPVDLGSIESGSEIRGRGGKGFRAPGEVR